MDYENKRRMLEGETGSLFIINAILSEPEEKATYDQINNYIDPYSIPREEELDQRLHNLQAFNMVTTETEQILGTEQDPTYFTLTEEGEEFLRQDLPNYETYKEAMKASKKWMEDGED